MTKEQRKDIEEFARNEWQFWSKIEPETKEVTTALMIYSYLSGRYPNMTIKTAHHIANEITRILHNEEN